MKIILDDCKIVVERVGENTFRISTPDVPGFIKDQIYPVYIKDTLTISIPNVIIEKGDVTVKK